MEDVLLFETVALGAEPLVVVEPLDITGVLEP